jgi:hypothetical protein
MGSTVPNVGIIGWDEIDPTHYLLVISFLSLKHVVICVPSTTFRSIHVQEGADALGFV